MGTITRDEAITALDFGREFYVEAAERVDREDFKILFRELAHSKEVMLEELRSIPRSHAGEDNLSEKLGSTYASILRNWNTDKIYQYLISMATSEDRLLHAFGSAVTNSDDPLVRAVALKYLDVLIHGHRRLLQSCLE